MAKKKSSRKPVARKAPRRKPRQKDTQQLARYVLNTVAPDADAPAIDVSGNNAKNPAAVALGRLGGLKGGKARAKKLTKKQRSDIAKKAARVRWSALQNESD